MARYPERLLERPGGEAARRIALTQLEAARGARRRLADLDDRTALHDLRVALRRLRSTIRSYRPTLDAAVPRKWRRRLRDLARATNRARDAEVAITWIEQRRKDAPRGRRAGVPWFVAHLADRRDRLYDDIRRAGAVEFDRLDARLRKTLGAVATSRRAKRQDGGRPEPPLAAVVSGLARDHAAELARQLGLVRSADDDAQAHAARIEAKRLRYLLEPLAAEFAPAATAAARLTQLQDLLGELHDVQLLIGELADALARAAGERARRLHHVALRGVARPKARSPRRPRPASAGLLALTRLAAEWKHRLFQRLVAGWLRDGLGALLRDLEALARSLAAVPSRGPRIAPRQRQRRKRTRRPAAATSRGGGARP